MIDHLTIVACEGDNSAENAPKWAQLQDAVGRELRLTSFATTASEGRRLFFMVDTTTQRFSVDRAAVLVIVKRVFGDHNV